ncbi:MAG: hypothetical protein MR531_14945 [Lachnospiraceae bacterium]|nr:hypothetical protein [Lachnospiraceae bacterium]
MNFANKGRNLVVYQSVWGNKVFPKLSIEANSKESPSSYRFAGDSQDACEIIKAIYMIENIPLFEKQYAKAVSGNGDEEKKILTLHSSSRLALLTFYNVDAEHILTLDINGESVDFDFSTFEFKNPVIGYPSNMDVVLVSQDRKSVLFLESKFAEYYLSAGMKSAPISTQYATNKYSRWFYDREWLESIGIDTSYDSENKFQKEFVLSMKDEQINYLDGFKQMISHYIGVRRRIDEKKRIASDQNSEENRKISDIVLSVVEDPESKIYLGEILYDKLHLPEGCEGELNPQKARTDYSKLYSKLAARMNERICVDGLANRFVVLSEELKYSDVIGVQAYVEPMTADFYG